MDRLQSPSIRYLICLVGIVTLVTVTSLVTVMATRASNPACAVFKDRPSGFSNQLRWEPAETIDVPGKEYTIKRSGGECYIYKSPLKKGVPRRLKVIPYVLKGDMVESLAGETAVEMCAGLPVFLAADETSIRRKPEKQPGISNVDGAEDSNDSKTAVPSENPRLNPRARRQAEKVDYDAPYNESVNENRCSDDNNIFDCGDESQIGKKVGCHTGINGFFWMERTCVDATTIRVEMTKPPGRIIKHLQRQFFMCEKRRKEGLRC